MHHGATARHQPLVIDGQAAIVVDPGERALDHPTLRHRDESLEFLREIAGDAHRRIEFVAHPFRERLAAIATIAVKLFQAAAAQKAVGTAQRIASASIVVAMYQWKLANLVTIVIKPFSQTLRSACTVAGHNHFDHA
jgi:hypothetical protein